MIKLHMQDAQDREADPYLIGEGSRTPWTVWEDAWSWVFSLIAFLVFESFANPGVSVAIACLKFGYADFRTAIWLRGDEHRMRGQAHALMYASRGCFVVTACGLFCLFAIGLCEQLILNNNPFLVLEQLLLTALVVAFLGAILGMMTVGFAFQMIGRGRIAVWMDPTIHRARRENQWNSVCYGQRNGFVRMTRAVITLSAVIFIILTIALVETALIDPPNPNHPLVNRLTTALIIFSFWGIPLGGVMLTGMQALRHAAAGPERVWP